MEWVVGCDAAALQMREHCVMHSGDHAVNSLCNDCLSYQQICPYSKFGLAQRDQCSQITVTGYQWRRPYIEIVLTLIVLTKRVYCTLIQLAPVSCSYIIYMCKGTQMMKDFAIVIPH